MAAEEHVENGEKNEKGIKRKRDGFSVLDHFTHLTNGNEKVRVKSGVNLLKYLTEGGDETKLKDELKYALSRLIRGLGATKQTTRTGFFTALVGVLNLKKVSIDEILQHVEKELHKGAGNSKSENADVCMGQILAAGAVLRSDLYSSSNDNDKRKILQLMINAGKERTYLNLICYKFLITLFDKVKSEEFDNVIYPLIKDELSRSWSEQNLDSFYLLLEVQEHLPKCLHSKFHKNNLKTEVISNEDLNEISKFLITVPRNVALKHPIYGVFIKSILKSGLLTKFFQALDNALSRHSRNKFLAATKLITTVLEHITDYKKIPDIFTTNYILQMIMMYKNSVGKQKDKEFQYVTQKQFEILVIVLKKDVDDSIKIELLNKFLFYPGIFIFEKVTKSKLIQNITGTLQVKGVKDLSVIYRDVVEAKKDKIVDSTKTEKWWNIDRVYASHLLVKLINHPVMIEENDWKTDQLIFLGEMALCNTENGNELSNSLKETFFSSLDLKLTKLDDLRYILSKVLHKFDEFGTLDEVSMEIWKKTIQLVDKLGSKQKKKNAVFHTLFLHLGLQLHNNAKLASDSLTELFSCYERIKKGENNDGPLWIEVIVDLFLNLLSHNSHVLRNVINCVFPHLCKYLNATAIHQILSVLDPENESNPLSKPDEESDDDEEESADDEESSESDDDSDDNVNEKLRMALHQALANNDDETDVDLDNLDEEEGEKLNETLAQAFKQFKPNLGTNRKQKKEDEALTHFRVRVLDLIEIYLNAHPSMSLTLEIMLPLLQLLEFCIKDEHQKPLQDRIKSCLKKLTSLKKFEDCQEMTDDILVELLRSLLEKGTRTFIIIQEMADKISDCANFVITCSQVLPNTHKSKIIKVVKEGLEGYFTKRDSSIPYVFFKNLFQQNWDGIIKLVPFLLGVIHASGIRTFKKSQSLELLKIFFNNQRVISGNLKSIGKIQDDVLNFLRDSLDFFREFSNDPLQKKVKDKFLGNLFELLHQVKVSVLGRSFENWGLLGEAVRECRSHVSFARDTRLAFNKLCRTLNISNVVTMKEKTVKLNNEEPEEVKTNGEVKKKKKKRNHNKETLKLKKESKELRLQSLSDGISSKRKFELEEEDEEDNKKIKSQL